MSAAIGRSVRLFLVDGNSTGFIITEIRYYFHRHLASLLEQKGRMHHGSAD